MGSLAARLLSIAGGVAAAAAATAQSPLYRDVTATHLPDGIAGPCMDAAAGDADGDGDLDLALAMEFQTNILLLNDGKGVFADGSLRLPRNTHDSEDVAFADFDGDGDLDLVLVSEDDRKDELYLNDGHRFTDASDRLVPDDVSNALVVLDLNGDGAPDLLTGNIGIDRALINDGRGNFRDETAQRWPQSQDESRTQDLETADVDGDGDLDVLVANEGQDQLYLNQNGRLDDATAGRLPTRGDETREIRAADVDGDGDLDLLVANVQFGMQETPQDYLLLNDGKGVFTTAERARFPEDARSNFTIQAVDLDADGDLDVLAPSTVFPTNAVEFLVLYADADGRTNVAHGPDFDVRDTDGDGDLDAVLVDGNRRQAFLLENGRFVATRVDLWVDAVPLEDEDVNDDERPDVAGARVPLAALGGRNGSLQIIDLDRDGDADVLIAATRTLDAVGDYLVLLNDGAGRFAAATPGTVLPATADGNGFDVEVADFDGDGATDLFFCNRASIPRPPPAAESSGGRQRLLLGTPRSANR